MFNIFRKNDEYGNNLIKQCPSCHGFIKSNEIKCRNCGNATQLKQNQTVITKETGAQSDNQPETDKEKFTI